MDRMSLRRVGAALALLVICVTGGCGQWFAPAPDRYVGTWAGVEDKIRIDRNGLGEGRVIRGANRPFTWELGVDRITITFDGAKRPEVLEGRLDAAGNLVISSPRTSVTLSRVTIPDPPAAGAPATPRTARLPGEARRGDKTDDGDT